MLETVVERARFWHVPLVVGEFGTETATRGGDVYHGQMLHLFAYHHLGWARNDINASSDMALLNANNQPNALAL